MSKIITKNNDGTVSVTFASPNWEGTMEELAKKVVPTGLTYKIVDASEIPTDTTYRNAWTIAESELTDGVGD